MRQPYRGVLTILVADFIVALAPHSALAVTFTWSGGNIFTGNLMTTAANWAGVAPTSGASQLTLVFPNVSNTNPNQDIANPISVQSLSFFGNYSMIGNGYQMNNLGAAPSMSVGGSSNASFGVGTTVSFTSPAIVTQGFASSLSVDQFNGSGLAFNSTANGAAAQLNFFGATPNALSGNLSFTGQYTVTAQKSANVAAMSGNVTLQGASATLVTTLRLASANQLAAGTNIFALSNSALSVLAPNLVNNLEVTGAGTTVNNNSSILTIAGQISSNSTGVSTIQNGTIDLNGGTKTINTSVAGGSLDMSSKITNGQIIKVGLGGLSMFNSANTFTGQNVVNAGVLAGNPNSLGTSVQNNAVVSLGTGTLTTNLISGPGSVSVGTITFGAAQSYTGGTNVGNQATGDSTTMLGDFSSSTFGEMVFTQGVNGAYAGNLSGNLKLTKQGAGVLALSGTNSQSNIVALAAGGLNLQANNAIGTGLLFVQNPGTTLQATGSVSLPNTLQFGAVTSFVGSGNLNFTDPTAKSLTTGFVHNSTGTTTIAGPFTLASGASLVVNSGNLVLGDPSTINGFVSNSTITLNGGILTAQSLNFISLSGVTLAGGTLNVPNGFALPLGAVLQGKGGVTGRVATANGSTILPSGSLTIGDSSHPAGVNLDGELYTGKFTVSLLDSNQAVLGSLTRLGGVPGVPGTVNAPNGAILNFGRNLDGNGNFNSTNALAMAVIINGDVNGLSPSDPVNFSGYVKGVGTFNNVSFGGTFSPGFSPALITMGNVGFTASNVFEEEIGGLNRGSQYDALDITGTLTLDGQLKVTLLNGFNPSLGNVFNIIDGTTAGAFSSYNFPALAAGLAWSTANLYTQGELQIVAVPEPGVALAISVIAPMLLRRRRRLGPGPRHICSRAHASM